MRARNIYDRDGNSYRYQRVMRSYRAKEEKIAQEKKWADIYKKLGGETQKHKDS